MRHAEVVVNEREKDYLMEKFTTGIDRYKNTWLLSIHPLLQQPHIFSNRKLSKSEHSR